MRTLCEALRNERFKNGFSQDFMAQNLNITQQAYSKIEKNPQKTCFETILKICIFLDLDLNSIKEEYKKSFDPNK